MKLLHCATLVGIAVHEDPLQVLNICIVTDVLLFGFWTPDQALHQLQGPAACVHLPHERLFRVSPICLLPVPLSCEHAMIGLLRVTASACIRFFGSRRQHCSCMRFSALAQITFMFIACACHQTLHMPMPVCIRSCPEIITNACHDLGM